MADFRYSFTFEEVTQFLERWVVDSGGVSLGDAFLYFSRREGAPFTCSLELMNVAFPPFPDYRRAFTARLYEIGILSYGKGSGSKMRRGYQFYDRFDLWEMSNALVTGQRDLGNLIEIYGGQRVTYYQYRRRFERDKHLNDVVDFFTCDPEALRQASEDFSRWNAPLPSQVPKSSGGASVCVSSDLMRRFMVIKGFEREPHPPEEDRRELLIQSWVDAPTPKPTFTSLGSRFGVTRQAANIAVNSYLEKKWEGASHNES